MTRSDDPDPSGVNDQRATATDADVSAGVELDAPAAEPPPADPAPAEPPRASPPQASVPATAPPVTAPPAHRASGSYAGFSPSAVPGPAPAPNRYGRPVAQPFNSQSSRVGAGRDISPPTVRFGGRTPSGPASPEPPSSRIRPTRIPRRASLQLRYLEPWSVLKISLVLSVAGFFAWMVAVGVLYGVLEGMGVWDQLNGTYSDLTSVGDSQAEGELISAGGVFGVAIVIGLVNIVLITAMCSVGSLIYNAAADFAGGIEVTLSERD